MDRSQQSPGDGSVGVGISSLLDRFHDPFFQVLGVQKLVEGILQSNQHPALVVLVVVLRRLIARPVQRLQHGRLDSGLPGLRKSGLVRFDRRCLLADGRGQGGDKDGTGALTDGVRMGQLAVLTGPDDGLGRHASPEDAEGADPHQGTVGLGLVVGCSSFQGLARGRAAVERARFVPVPVAGQDGPGIVEPVADQGAGQLEGQLGVVGGLAGQEGPDSSIPQLAQPGRVLPAHVIGGTEFDLAAQRVAGQLAQ